MIPLWAINVTLAKPATKGKIKLKLRKMPAKCANMPCTWYVHNRRGAAAPRGVAIAVADLRPQGRAIEDADNMAGGSNACLNALRKHKPLRCPSNKG